MSNLKNFFYKKKVIVTGHTGFKGSWLTLWLKTYGANIFGISKDIPTKPEAPAISYPFWDGITSPIFNMSTSIILGFFLLWINRGVRIPKWGQRLAFKFKLVH